MDDGLNHPADRLALVRQRIKALQEEEAELKAACVELAPEDRVGRWNEVKVATVSRTALDSAAVKALLEEVEQIVEELRLGFGTEGIGFIEWQAGEQAAERLLAALKAKAYMKTTEATVVTIKPMEG